MNFFIEYFKNSFHFWIFLCSFRRQHSSPVECFVQPSATEQEKNPIFIDNWLVNYKKNRQNWLPNENLVCAKRRQRSKL